MRFRALRLVAAAAPDARASSAPARISVEPGDAIQGLFIDDLLPEAEAFSDERGFQASVVLKGRYQPAEPGWILSAGDQNVEWADPQAKSGPQNGDETLFLIQLMFFQKFLGVAWLGYMKNLSILFPEDMHHRQLHVVRQFGPNMKEWSSSVFLSPNSSENFTLWPTLPSLAHWKT